MPRSQLTYSAVSLSVQWARCETARTLKAQLPRYAISRAVRHALMVGLTPWLADKSAPYSAKKSKTIATNTDNISAKPSKRPVWQIEDLGAEITLRIVDAPEGRRLNHDYRGKDYATNVLTFDYTRPPQSPVVAADIVFCAPVVLSEAHNEGKLVRDHFLHLIVHGVLHACGYDHETSDADAQVMEALEVAALARLGVGDPYNA